MDLACSKVTISSQGSGGASSSSSTGTLGSECFRGGLLLLQSQQQQQQQQQQQPQLHQQQIVPRVHQLLPKIEPVDLQFENLSYSVPNGLRTHKKRILHGINGRFPAGTLIAIMGPSGAGKSTLLDILSGYRKTNVTGVVTVNGRERNLKAFRRYSCYITQDDRLQPLLTVAENMAVAADLKLSAETDSFLKLETISDILKTLGLFEARNTSAGRLSGGQKKRLSIALELINNPLVMFLDEPTTGLDSSSCSQCVSLLKMLAKQGRTIICTIHQPSASIFQLFDSVYVLAAGQCLYQGSVNKLIAYFDNLSIPCPMYHNPADYVIELACGEYGFDKIDLMVQGNVNGTTLDWFEHPELLPDKKALESLNSKINDCSQKFASQETTQLNQLKVLLSRGFLKAKRDSTLTHLRIVVNLMVSLMLGVLYINAGNDGSKVLDNYNLLFSILMHHMMSTMMLTILTFPNEMSILIKEHFNRWYSLKSYYLSITIVDLPISIFCCLLFSLIIYFMSAQPPDPIRFAMFTAISILVVFVAQSFGLMIGALFNVVNGTFLGPTLSVPMMMFAGFGVTLRDLPAYLKWGSYVSYLRYGLEGYVGAIYGRNRTELRCMADYCHYRYPEILLNDISMRGDQFWNDIAALVAILVFLRTVAFLMLRFKLILIR